MKADSHIIIVTDAWYPHLSGVLRVVESLSAELDARGIGYTVLHPQSFPRVPVPGYSEIKIALPIFFESTIDSVLKKHKNASIHIMTEGSLGLTMRNYCVARGLKFTTSFHTHWHKYLKVYFKVPQRVTMRYIQDFHKPAQRVLVPSEDAKDELVKHGFNNEVVVCANGVDVTLFHPRKKSENVKRPHMLYVGRISKEKSIGDFLDIKTKGSKKVVGDGPLRESLKKKYPEVEFTGPLQGEELAHAYANADVFVFPSKTDTFGVVLLEALASGVPVAAYPSPGPLSILTKKGLGGVSTNLEEAVHEALRDGESKLCLEHAQNYSWSRITETFINSLESTGTPTSTKDAFKEHLLRVPKEFYKLFTSAGYARSLLLGFDRHGDGKE